MHDTVLASPIQFISRSPDCPIIVAAARVRAAREADVTIRFVSGWGASEDEAVRGCMWEAAERYSAQALGTEAVRRATIEQLDGVAIAPPEILLIGDRQYRRRRSWNASHPGFNELPIRWRAGRPLDWVESTPHLSAIEAWLPAGLCFLGHERDRTAGLPPADSCGVAAGATIEDATVRAFAELVERDAVAIWWYNRIPRPRLAPEILNVPLVRAYHAWSKSCGRVLRLLDLTHDLGMAVVAAVAHDDGGGTIAIGFGNGPSRRSAARHAVGELAQFESNVALIESRVRALGEFGLAPEARALLQWFQFARLSDNPHLVGGDVATVDEGETSFDLARCHELCTRQRLKFMALNLTRARIGVPVVRVIVPGLRPIWARFAAGRLYDVPVRMGWRSTPISCSALNPVPLMF